MVTLALDAVEVKLCVRFRFINFIEHRSTWIGSKAKQWLSRFLSNWKYFFQLEKSVVIWACWGGVGPTFTAQGLFI